ncbi:YhgE/Pip domain-containing protein [Nocardia sp. NPDC055029]
MAITVKDLMRWLRPSAVVAVLAALLATMYLGYIVDPEGNLHDFPVGLVNLDVGDVVGGQQVNVGDQIEAALVQQIPADTVDLREMGLPELHRAMLNGTIYGAIVIPSDFTKRVSILGAASVVPGDVERPVTVRAILYYDARASSGLAHGVWMALLGLAIGLVIGLVATSFYDRKGLERRAGSTSGTR